MSRTALSAGLTPMRIVAQPAFINRAGNPYNWLLYTELSELGFEVDEFSRWRLLTGSYDVWHLHWPEAPLNARSTRRALTRLAELIASMDVARRLGTKIVWTVHNLSAHEERHPLIANWFWNGFIRRLDGFISLSTTGHALALERFPRLARLPGFVVPHGHYRGVYAGETDARAARARLGLEPTATVLAFVGQIRRYKGVSALCEAFSGLADHGARLLIAGKVKDASLADELRCAAKSDSRIRLRLEFVPDDELHVYLGAADLVVLPFTNVLNTGSALLALSFDRPVLVPRTGPLAELRDRVGAEWMHTYENELTPELVAEAIRWTRQTQRTGRPRLESLDWPAVAQQTAEALRSIANLPTSTQPHTTARLTRNDGPKVSVVIPVYNRATPVRRAIESVLRQTYQNFEIIVVDDASSDHSVESVRSISDPRLTVICHDRNRGGSAARNTGIRASSGEYVAFLDSDDEWLPDKIQRQLAVFGRSDDRLALVYTGANRVYENQWTEIHRPRRHDNVARALLLDNVVGETSVGMVRRGVLNELSGFDETLPARQDVDLWLRIAERYRVEVVPDVLVTVSKVNDQDRITANIAGRMKAREIFGRKHRDELARAGVLHVYLRQSGWKYYRELGESEAARRCYKESLAVQCLAPLTYPMLLLAFVPASVWDPARRCKRHLTRLLRSGRHRSVASRQHSPPAAERFEA
jgi:beta-1,4-mannosyltransferase